MSDERDRLSLLAHVELPMLGPLSSVHLDALLAPLAPAPDRTALDLGGGRGDLAILAHDRLSLRVTSVDRSRVVCGEGRRRAGDRAITIVRADARAHLDCTKPRDLALAACLGSTHALGGIVATIGALVPTLAIDGALVVADLVRLADLGEEPFHDLPTPEEVDRALAAHGLAARARILVGPDALAAYERAWRAATERHLATHPEDPGAEWARARNAAMDRAARALRSVGYLAITATPT